MREGFKLKETRRKEERTHRIMRNVALMVLLASFIVICIPTAAKVIEGITSKAPEVIMPEAYKSYTDAQVTNVIFSTLVSKTSGLLSGEAVFEVNNIFNKNITITQDYEVLYDGIDKTTYYKKVNVTKTKTVANYEKVNVTILNNKTNKNETQLVEIVNGTKEENYNIEEWIETTIIPAKYTGYLKVISDYKTIAFGRPQAIDWVPKIEVKTSALSKKTYKQKDWAWWNSTWNFSYPINISSGDGLHLNEYLTINVTTLLNCSETANYSDLRLLRNNTTEMGFRWLNNVAGNRRLVALFNSSNTAIESWNTWEYWFYCNSTEQTAVNISQPQSFDDFETGEVSADWFVNAGTMVLTSESAEVAHGNYGMKYTSGAGQWFKYHFADANGWNKDFKVSFWFKRNGSINTRTWIMDNGPVLIGFDAFHSGDVGTFKWSHSHSDPQVNTSYPFAFNEWEYDMMEYNDTPDTWTWFINDTRVAYNVGPTTAAMTYGWFLPYEMGVGIYDDFIASTYTGYNIYDTRPALSVGAEQEPTGGVADGITITNLEESPAEPQQYHAPITFNATITHTLSYVNISIVTFELNGTNYTTTGQNISGIANESTLTIHDLTEGVWDYTWYANTTKGTEAITDSGTYQIVETISIQNNYTIPLSPTTWDVQSYTFLTNVTHLTNNSIIDTITFELDGTNYTTGNTTVNTTTLNASYIRTTGLDVGNHAYAWYGNSTTGKEATRYTGVYTINKATNNNVSIIVTPSTSIGAGDSVTITCNSSEGTPTLEVDRILYSSPQTLTLLTGTHNATCFVVTANYSSISNGTFITVGSLQAASAGCAGNYTYAFEGELIITNNTITVINMTDWAGTGVYFRDDLQDVLIYGHQYWVNNSELLIVNTTGETGTVLTVYFGNAFLNNEINTSWGGDITSNETFDNVTVIGNYTTISFVDEITATTAIPSNMSSFVIDFTCTDGNRRHTFTANTTTTEYLFASNYTFEDAITTVQYSDGSVYTRAIQYSHPIENRFIWLMDAQLYTVAKVTNTLIDYTNEFSNANMTIKRIIGNSLRIIDERSFDGTNIHAWYGLEGKRYQYHISNRQETRTFGEVLVDLLDLDKTIVISSFRTVDIEYMMNITYYESYNNTTGAFSFYWNDPYARTNQINITLTNIDNNTQEYYSSSAASIVTFSTVVQNTTARYMWVVRYDHSDELDEGEIVGYSGDVDNSMWFFFTNHYDTWKIISFMIILMVVLSSSYVSFPLGLLAATSLLYMFIRWGLLPISSGLIAVLVGITILVLIRKGGEEK